MERKVKKSTKKSEVKIDDIDTNVEEVNIDDYNPSDEKEDLMTLDQIVKKFEEANKDTKFIDQDEFFDETSYLDLSDQDYERIFDHFKELGYEVAGSKDNDLENEDMPDDFDENDLENDDTFDDDLKKLVEFLF